MTKFFYRLNNNNSEVKALKVIPVIDILGGAAVHAVRGERGNYKTLQSVLCSTAEPVDVAKSFESLGFSWLYVADLDAIIKDTVNLDVFRRISNETKLDLMVDAGISFVERSEQLIDCGVSKIIIGTETLHSMSFIAEAVKKFGSETVLPSLDLKSGDLLVKSGFDGYWDPLNLLNEYWLLGVTQVIVLDLARVGSGSGLDLDFLSRIIEAVDVDVYVGGGVRDMNDLADLEDLGVSGVLVATALHNGKISLAELRSRGFI
mgnify:FL=1